MGKGKGVRVGEIAIEGLPGLEDMEPPACVAELCGSKSGGPEWKSCVFGTVARYVKSIYRLCPEWVFREAV